MANLSTIFDGAGPYDTSGAPTDMPEVAFADFKLTGYSTTEHVYFVVHYTDGTSASFTLTGAALAAAGTTPYDVDAPAGKFIDWIDLTRRTETVTAKSTCCWSE